MGWIKDLLNRPITDVPTKEEWRRWDGMAKAKGSDTSLEEFKKLAKDRDYFVRIAVAESPETPPSVLEMLMKDKEPFVRISVVENPNAPQYIRELDPWVRL